MFKTPDPVVDGATGLAPRRWHRALTLPALVVAFAVLALHPYFLITMIVFPPMIALPFLARAAASPTEANIETAHMSVRIFGHVMCAFSAFLAIWAVFELRVMQLDLFWPALIEAIAATTLLVAAGKHPRESRLGAAAMVIGVQAILASGLLIWFGAQFLTLVPAGVALFVGGLWWLIEAESAPASDSTLPFAIVR